MPNEVLDQIVDRTDGVPLFIEELTKMVLESDLLQDVGGRYTLSTSLPSTTIPASLQDSLMARLDHLGPVKDTAQLAATLGRSFEYKVLTAVSPLDRRELDNALSQLAQAGLIYQRGLPPDLTYEFKHALVQDTAYQSLLKTARQRHHEHIAHVLEKEFSETAENEPELLAHHYTEAGLVEPAIRYWQRAGERATERSANQEAIAHLSRALELLALLPENPARDQLELTLQIDLGGAILMTQGHTSPEVERVYSRARVLGQKVGETPQLIPALFGLWRYYGARPDFQAARELGQQLLRLGEDSTTANSAVRSSFDSVRIPAWPASCGRAWRCGYSDTRTRRPPDASGVWSLPRNFLILLVWLLLFAYALLFMRFAEMRNPSGITPTPRSASHVSMDF